NQKPRRSMQLIPRGCANEFRPCSRVDELLVPVFRISRRAGPVRVDGRSAGGRFVYASLAHRDHPEDVRRNGRRGLARHSFFSSRVGRLWGWGSVGLVVCYFLLVWGGFLGGGLSGVGRVFSFFFWEMGGFNARRCRGHKPGTWPPDEERGIQPRLYRGDHCIS